MSGFPGKKIAERRKEKFDNGFLIRDPLYCSERTKKIIITTAYSLYNAPILKILREALDGRNLTNGCQ